MRFKIDENLPSELAVDLRDAGHDADTVFDEDLGGALDSRLMEAALTDGRTLLTLDKGIASLERYPPGTHEGIVLFRPSRSGRGEVLAFIRERLDDFLGLDLPNRVIVVTPSRIRTRHEREWG